MAGRLSLGGFAAAGLIRTSPSSRASVTAAACRGRVVAALRGSSNARRRFSEEWNADGDAFLETIGDVDRKATPLPPPSPEQAEVVDSVRARNNVVCEAVAGSGKTTTVLHCAREVPGLQFLVLTYNARLKLTTRQRAKELGLRNVETHSFHACAAKYYAPECRNDETLRQILEENVQPRTAIRFDCLVVDEAQDMTPLLHRFVLKILRDAGNDDSTVLVLGDSRQSIYEFRDADSRFLTMADRGVYALSIPESDTTEEGDTETDAESVAASAETTREIVPRWRHHTLRTSFRASPRIASFVNDAMLGFECIKPYPRPHLPDGGAGMPVSYFVGNAFQVASQEIADEIEYLLSPRGGGYAPDDIFVLTPSLKGAKLNSKTPLAQLENTLVMRCGVPVYVSLADEEELSDSLVRGKICFTTFHSSKGLERPVVIVFGFSGDYFTYFARDAPKAVCPNALYVAATRASERLYVVGEQEKGGKLPFLRLDPESFEKWGLPLPDWLEVRRCGKLRPFSDASPVPASSFGVTDLAKFLPERTLRDAVRSVEPVIVEPAVFDTAAAHSIPSLVGAGSIESVSDITGLAVVAVHEHRHARSDSVSNASHSTSLARRLQTSLAKMERQLKANAARPVMSETDSKSRDGSPNVDLIVDDVEAIRQMREVLSSPPKRVRDFLKLASWYEAMEGGYLFRPFQLSHFDWIDAEAATAVAAVLEKHLPTENSGDETSARPPPARYEKRYDVSFRFGAAIVTIRGAADVVTAAGANGEIFEVKCVARLLPEHALQLALYLWLDAFAQVQDKIHRARERRRRMTNASENASENGNEKRRAHRGFKGSGKNRREYTEEEAEDPLRLLEHFFEAGGKEERVMKRAALLNARTGEVIEVRASLRALTDVVVSLVDQKIRVRARVSDEVFLENARRAGAAIHEKAAAPEDGGFVPTPEAAFERKPSEHTAATRSARGGEDREVEDDEREATETKKKTTTTKTTTTKTKRAGSGRVREPRAVPGAVVETVTVNGVSRACDVKRRILTEGDIARPRGRAPNGKPYWDAVAGEFVAPDETVRETSTLFFRRGA